MSRTGHEGIERRRLRQSLQRTKAAGCDSLPKTYVVIFACPDMRSGVQVSHNICKEQKEGAFCVFDIFKDFRTKKLGLKLAFCATSE